MNSFTRAVLQQEGVIIAKLFWVLMERAKRYHKSSMCMCVCMWCVCVVWCGVCVCHTYRTPEHVVIVTTASDIVKVGRIRVKVSIQQKIKHLEQEGGGTGGGEEGEETTHIAE